MTPNQRLAGIILGQPVTDWILARRAEGKSWRTIRTELKDATNGQVDVVHETLRYWAGEGDAA